MNKDQEILAVSRLVFELTKIGSVDADLDRLQARLFDLLHALPGICVIPKSALLLFNPRHRLVQVAQFGLPAAWGRASQQGNEIDPSRAFDPHARLGTPATHRPALSLVGIEDQAPCLTLPLSDNGKSIGYLLVFIEADWQPDAVELEFMSDLAQAVSMLVSRSMVNETLRVREVELEDARTDAIRRLGTASEYRDNETGMHIMRMTHYATSIAKAMGLSLELRELLAICAPMHDVGKIGIADAILLKPGRLTPDEFEVMKTHTEIGKRLLEGSDALISAARDIAAYHHERWDGTGYPYGLRGEEIPVLARVCAIADVFDALTSIRPYKRPWSFEDAIAYVHQEAGRYFDPSAVAAFDRAMPEIIRIRELYRDDIIDPNQVLDLPPVAYREDRWVAWDEALSVGIDVIDEHHRYLFDLTNDLFDVVAAKRGARDVARILKSLDQYAQVHFRAEERMMAHHAYGEQDKQHAQHRDFETRLDEFYGELHDNPLTAQFDVLIYLRDWLIKHIKLEDAKLKELVTTNRK
ncbi:bacteriohemerythrin [Dechloromonas denitrificans]|uniref:bacteriohemerythrin n=1 Tax=Dechloromonas denitrificans TaxID=281362 RepID=UPI001CF8BD2E|nr:bacteriohemerythrin [Dechloromonas denitrificans]UCV10868.1 bacteriohemerythrin [Dechloromonas denitrificans]